MSRLQFGVDKAPVVSESMAYTGRAICGHIQIIVVDTGRVSAFQDLAELYGSGLLLERIPVADAQRDFGECDRCQPPDQLEMPL